MPLTRKTGTSRARSSIAAAALLASFAAAAQTYPVKPIRVVVPNPAGGIDAYARIFQPGFAAIIGQQMLLENRPGASGAIGAENIARATPDGYSLPPPRRDPSCSGCIRRSWLP